MQTQSSTIALPDPLNDQRRGWPWEGEPRSADQVRVAQLPRISVVTPSFNQGDYLEATIRSVLLQGYANLEYLILDGGSQDASVAIIQHYEPWLAYWHSRPDRGQSDAINQGLRQATGEIVGWLNSDDVLLPGTLRLIGEYFATHPQTVLVYGNAQLISREGEVLGPNTHTQPFDERLLLEHDDIVPQPSAFFRQSAFRSVGGLDETLHYALDWDLWIRLGRCGPVAFLPDFLSQMRIYPEAKTYSGGQKVFNEIRSVVERYGGHGFPTIVRQWIVLDQIERARQAFIRGDFASGRQALDFMQAVAADQCQYDIDHWARLVADWACNQLTLADPVAAARQICGCLPATLPGPALIQQRALSIVYQSLARQDQRSGRRWRAVANVARAVRADRRLLSNRGLLALVVHSLLPWLSPAKSGIKQVS
jgi:glycosyltransferase involved in cell wall biosynthesis